MPNAISRFWDGMVNGFASPEYQARNQPQKYQRQPVQVQGVPPTVQITQQQPLPDPQPLEIPKLPPEASQPDLAALQRHAFGVGGPPQQEVVSAPLQVQGPAPVQIRTPDMPMPQAKPMTQQQTDAQAQRLSQDVHIAGLRGVQQGFYDPFAESSQMVQQQQANYAGGQNSLLQALAQTGADDRARLQRDLQIGQLGVQRGNVEMESQKSAAEDATKRAVIASTEGIEGKKLTSEELRARMGAATQLQGHLITARGGILQAQANQKGMADAATMTAMSQNPEFMQKILGGGDQAKEAIDFLRATHSRMSAGQASGADLMGGLLGANDPYAAQLSGMGVGTPQPPPIMPLPPQGQVQVNPSTPATNQETAPTDPFARREANATNFVPRADLMKGLGDKKNFESLLAVLAQHGDRVSPQDADHLIKEVLNAGARPEDLETAAGKRLLLHQRKTGVSPNSPYRVATQNEGTSFLGIPMTGQQQNVQVLGPDGQPVFAGREPAFSLGQWWAGTRPFTTDNPSAAGDTADRRESDATATLLGALQRRRAAAAGNSTSGR